MKIKQVSEHIWSIKMWMFIPIHVWVVVDEEGNTLVDAGLPIMSKGIQNFLKQSEIGTIQRILLTHGHSDHVGAVKSIVEDKKVPVYAHPTEIPYMEGYKLYPSRKKFENNVRRKLVQPLQTDEQGELVQIAGLTPYLTPGHSPGHVVYYHDKDRVLLAGDLFTSKRGKLQKPMSLFTGDMNEAVKSSDIVKQLNPKRLEVCHGDPVFNPADQLELYVQKMKS